MDEAGISRREFFNISAGTLLTLAASEGGFLFPFATEAYAEELSEGEGSASFYVVRSRELGIVVSDQANGAKTPIQGAKVTLTSRYNGRSVSDTTIADGSVVFDIAELAEPTGDEAHAVYDFNGTLRVEKDGYRIFDMALTRIHGGDVVAVPTRKLEDGVPYPSMVSFDSWDVLYSRNIFVETVGNDTRHDLRVDIKNLSKSATLQFWVDDEASPRKSLAITPVNGQVSATMSDFFLQTGLTAALPVDASFHMAIVTSTATYTFPLALGIMEGAADAGSTHENVPTTPVNGITPASFTFTVPDYIPLIGGTQFTPWLPQWNTSVVLDPFGFFYIAWKTPRVGYVEDNSTPNPKKWGYHPYQDSADQFDKFMDTALDKKSNVYETLSRGSGLQHVKFSKIISATASLRFSAQATWDYSTGEWQGDAAAAALLEFSLALSEQFGVGPIPCFVGFNFVANLCVQAIIGFYAKDALSPGTYDWDYTNTGATATLTLAPSVTLGVGIAGVASASIRGSLALTMYAGLTPMPGLDIDEYPLPHYIIGASGQADVMIQMLLFKWSGKFWSFSVPHLKDNWYQDKLEGLPAEPANFPGAFTLSDGSYCYRVQNGVAPRKLNLWKILETEAVPITDEELEGVASLKLPPLLGETPLYDNGRAQVIEPSDTDLGGTFYPWDDNLLRKAEDMQTGTQLKTYADFPESVGVSSIDEYDGGVWPSADVLLSDNCLPDPRFKPLLAKNAQTGVETPHLWRLSGVYVENKGFRSRVTVCKLEDGKMGWEKHYPIWSSVPWVDREDFYDYDFDIVSNPEGSDFYEIVLSGLRTKGDYTDSPFEAFDRMFLTVVHYDVQYGYVYSYNDFTWEVSLDSTFPSINQHCVFCPRIAWISGSGDEFCVAATWVHRFSQGDETLSSDNAKECLGAAIITNKGVYLQNLPIHTLLSDNTVYEVVIAKGPNDDGSTAQAEIAVRGEAGTQAFVADIQLPTGETLPAITHLVDYGRSDIVNQLVPWKGRNCFLTSYEGALTKVDLQNKYGEPALTPLGLAGFNVTSFGMDSSGTFIYYPENRYGDIGGTYDEDGNYTPNEVAQTRMMACMLHDGLFSHPYIFSHLNHPMEQMIYLGTDKKCMSFLSVEVTSFAWQRASYWLTQVPAVACPTLMGCASDSPLVEAGRDACFLFTVRNDGNVYLTGAKATMYDESGTQIEQRYVGFRTSNRQISVWDKPAGFGEAPVTVSPHDPFVVDTPTAFQARATSFVDSLRTANIRGDADGVPYQADYEDEDAPLAPGDTAVFATYFTIPADWEGNHTVTFTLSDAEFISAEAMPTETNLVNMGHVTFDKTPISFTVQAGGYADEGLLQDAPITVEETGDAEPGGDTPTPGGDTPAPGGETPAPKGGQTPPTGDPTWTGSGTAALAGLGAAAFAAYSARRTAIENEEREQ